jgi:hypothetical protein
LDKGSIHDRGESRKVVGEYLAQTARNQEQILTLANFARLHNRDNRLRLKSLEWLCELPLRHGEPVKVLIHFDARVPVKDVVVGIGFSTIDGRRLLTYESDIQDGYRPSFNEPGIHSVEIQIDTLPLAPDNYSLDIGARSGDIGSLDYIPATALLDIVPGHSTPAHIIQNDAAVRLESKWVWNREDLAGARIGHLKVADLGR